MQPADRASDARALALLQRLSNCRDVPAVLLALAEALPALLPHSDRVSLALLEPDGANLRVYRLLPPLLPQPEQLPRVRVAGTVVGQVATDGKPRAVADVRDDDQLRFGRASHDGIRSTASVPVRVAGRLVGALNAGVKKVGGCRASDLEDLAVLAAVVGPALWLAEHRVALQAATLAERPRPKPANTLPLTPMPAPPPAPRAPEPAADWPTRDEQERRYLLRVLGHTGGRIEGRDGAAKLLGMAPSTLRSRAQRLGLDLQTVRPAGKE